jgi:hypothetical protein
MGAWNTKPQTHHSIPSTKEEEEEDDKISYIPDKAANALHTSRHATHPEPTGALGVAAISNMQLRFDVLPEALAATPACYNGQWHAQSRRAIVAKLPPSVPAWLTVSSVATKNSASASIVMFGNQRAPGTSTTQVAIKLSPRSMSRLEQCVVEANIIEFEFNAMIRLRWCPHVVRCVAAQPMRRTDLFPTPLPPPLVQHAAAFDRQLATLRATNGANLSYDEPWNALVTERGTSSLADLIASKPSLSDHEFAALLLQSYYTLECLPRLGIRHNDMHPGNLLYFKLDKAELFPYAIPNSAAADAGQPPVVCVQFRTRHMVKFFDMDYGTDADPRLLANLPSWPNSMHAGNDFAMYDCIGFSFGIAKLLAATYGEHHAWTHMLVQLIGADAWNMSQQWAHQDQHQSYKRGLYAQHILVDFNKTVEGARIARNFRTPLAMMHALLQHPALATSVLPRSVMPAIRPFCLPSQHQLVAGTVEQRVLGPAEYAGVAGKDGAFDCSAHLAKFDESLMWNYAVEPTQANAAEWSQWTDLFRSWTDSGRVNGPAWRQRSSELYRQFQTRGARQPPANQPSTSMPLAVLFFWVCTFLTCNMFYRLSPAVRAQLRRECTARLCLQPALMLRMELYVWLKCNGRITRVPRAQLIVVPETTRSRVRMQPLSLGIAPTPLAPPPPPPPPQRMRNQVSFFSKLDAASNSAASSFQPLVPSSPRASRSSHAHDSDESCCAWLCVY